MKTLTFSILASFATTLSLICHLAIPVRASATYGSASDIFNIGAGARSMAMGSAFTGLSDDASAPYFNPAGLAFLDEHQLMAMHAPLFIDTDYNYFATANPFGDKWGTLAVSNVLMQSTGFELRNANNEVTDSNGSLRNTALSGSYAHKITARTSAGANFKFIQQKAASYSDGTIAFDAGVMAKPYPFLSLGSSLSNLNSPSVKLRSDKDVYKPVLKFGAASNLYRDRLLVSADIIRAQDQGTQFAGGLEFKAHSLLDLRTGYNAAKDFTFGMGINLKTFSIDYAFSSTDLGSFNKVSFMWAWHNIYQSGINPPLQEGRAVFPIQGFENHVVFMSNVPDQTVARWTLAITDEQGNEVRQLGADLTPPQKIVWDAKNSVGEPIVAGVYSYNFSVEYKNGKSWQNKGNINMTLPNRQNDQTIDMRLDVNGAQQGEMQGNAVETSTPISNEPSVSPTNIEENSQQ